MSFVIFRGNAALPLRVLAATLVLIIPLGCGDEDAAGPSAGPVVSVIQVDPATHSLLGIDDTVRINAAAKSASGQVLDVAFTWSSSDEGVSTVDANGRVSAVASGTTTITASANGVTGSAIVTVRVWELMRRFDQPPWGRAAAGWASGPTDIWVGGYEWLPFEGRIARFDGSTWSVEPIGLRLAGGIAGTSSSDVWVVGWGTEAHHFNGAGWTAVDLPGTDSLELGDAWASAPNDVWAVGPFELRHAPRALRYDGLEWKELTPPGLGPVHLLTVWGSSASDVWIGGTERTLLHFDGNELRNVTATLGAFGIKHVLDIWGFGPSDVWAVVVPYLDEVLLVHYDGVEWSDATPPGLPFVGDAAVDPHAYAVGGTGPDDLWLGGSWTLGFPTTQLEPGTRRSALLHYDGTSWREVMGIAGDHESEWTHIWTAGDSDVWGQQGFLNRRPGVFRVRAPG